MRAALAVIWAGRMIRKAGASDLIRRARFFEPVMLV